jgi:hypothetical protein
VKTYLFLFLLHLAAGKALAQSKPPPCPPGWEKQPEKFPKCSCQPGDDLNQKKPWCGCPPGHEKQPDKFPWCQPLPVTLTSFTARAVEASVWIEWTFADPEQHAGFILERSADALNFQVIARQPQTRYHDYPPCGPAYYRLSSQDQDGTVHAYQIIAVQVFSCAERVPVYDQQGRQMGTARPAEAAQHPANQVYIINRKKRFRQVKP